MKKNMIFLSYRRDDSPGYVSKLEAELESVFGAGRVFRDAEDIAGGAQWKTVIDDSLRGSAALLLVIGPRWEQIWHERASDPVNYVALELERARELGVPVIPVTLDGVQLSKDIDLGNIEWLRDKQTHDISDRQGRWSGDFARLVHLLESIDGIDRVVDPSSASNVTPAPEKKTSMPWKWLAIGMVLLVLGIAYLGTGEPQITGPNADTDAPATQRRAGAVETVAATTREAPVEIQREVQRETPPTPARAVPRVAGIWQGADGTIYHVSQTADGAIAIESPGYASGRAVLSPNRPRMFMVELFGVGRGEFALSTSGDKMMGYIVIDGQQEFDTLLRID